MRRPEIGRQGTLPGLAPDVHKGHWWQLNDGLWRKNLPDGFFLDRGTPFRNDGHRYQLYLAGGSADGTYAGWRGYGDTMRDVQAVLDRLYASAQ